MIDAKRIEEMKRLSAEADGGYWHCKNGEIHTDMQTATYRVFITDENAQFIAESRQFVPDIIADYEEQISRVAAHSTVIKGMSEMLEERDAEIAKLRKALEFYADEDNYGADVHYNGLSEPIYWKSIAENDEGDIAREALK